jgi:hypothetical protein
MIDPLIGVGGFFLAQFFFVAICPVGWGPSGASAFRTMDARSDALFIAQGGRGAGCGVEDLAHWRLCIGPYPHDRYTHGQLEKDRCS